MVLACQVWLLPPERCQEGPGPRFLPCAVTAVEHGSHCTSSGDHQTESCPSH